MKFADIYRDHMWVPMIEKTLAKIIGNYRFMSTLDPANYIRAISGAPVFKHLTATAGETATTIFTRLKTNIDKHYILTAKTIATAALLGTKLANARVYSVLQTFTLGTSEVILLRDPTGINTYDGLWKNPITNTVKWTDAYLKAIRYSNMLKGDSSEIRIDDGIFFMQSDEFKAAFESYYIGYTRVDNGYESSWYDVDKDDGLKKSFTVTVPEQRGDLYFTVETYY